MTKYYMISTRNNEDNYWEPCKSITITGAKREATREYGAGFRDATLMIAETAPGQPIATKSNWPGSKWEGER